MGSRPTATTAGVLAYALACLLLLADPVAITAPADGADLEEDPWGEIAELPSEPGAHWVWVNDRVLKHSVLFDGDSGHVLGMVDGSTALSGRPPYLSPERGEIYVVETFYSRGSHGERNDLITVYDARMPGVPEY